MLMKKKQLEASVKEYKNETAAAIVTIINAITAKGQRKKLLADASVQALLAKYDIDIS
jgi:hypothetical protein